MHVWPCVRPDANLCNFGCWVPPFYSPAWEPQVFGDRCKKVIPCAYILSSTEVLPRVLRMGCRSASAKNGPHSAPSSRAVTTRLNVPVLIA